MNAWMSVKVLLSLYDMVLLWSNLSVGVYSQLANLAWVIGGNKNLHTHRPSRTGIAHPWYRVSDEGPVFEPRRAEVAGWLKPGSGCGSQVVVPLCSRARSRGEESRNKMMISGGKWYNWEKEKQIKRKGGKRGACVRIRKTQNNTMPA